MTPCEPGGVLLVRFPFTDLSATRKRPVAVLSPADFSTRHGDVVVIALTGHRQAEQAAALDDWRAAGLLKPTWIKPLVATLAAGIVDHRLGRLSARDRRRVVGVLRVMLAPEFVAAAPAAAE